MAGPLVAVWSPKGGVGKTLIAAGLAMHLVRRLPGGTLLIDLDAAKADVAPLLKVSTRPSVLDYAGGDGKTVVHPTGLQVLPGPARLVDEGYITGDLAEAVLAQATERSAAVVADLGSQLRDAAVVALERANVALLVTTPDLLSIYAVRRFTQEAALIGLNLAKFRLVINRTYERQEIPDPEIVDLAGVQLAGRIPSLPGLAASVNRGMTSTTVRSNTEFALSLHLIAERLTFAGLPPSPAATVNSTRPANEPRIGILPALKRWWRSL